MIENSMINLTPPLQHSEGINKNAGRESDKLSKRIKQTNHSTQRKKKVKAKKRNAAEVGKESSVAAQALYPNNADYSNHPEILSLKDFIEKSPTAWHAVDYIKNEFLQKGFEELDFMTMNGKLKSGGKYFLEKNDSTVVAFVMPNKKPKSCSIIGGHTDSPALKLKPNAEIESSGLNLLLPEFYGGPILPTWFSRDLKLAGRVTYIDDTGETKWKLYDSEEAVAHLPPAPIHLNRDQLKKLEINEQKHLPVITTLAGTHQGSFVEHLLLKKINFKQILGKELFLCPAEKPRCFNGQFLSSWRLDNLMGTHAAYRSLLENADPEEDRIKIFISWDNEEVGSETAQGAASSLIDEILSIIFHHFDFTPEESIAYKEASGIISIDSAHAENPNYKELYDTENAPRLAGGPVIKFNAQQHYSTDSISESWVREVAQKYNVPVSEFCARTDGRCGTTIGPIVSTKQGIRGCDIGVSQLAMHSIRELFALVDHLRMIKLLEGLYKHEFVVKRGQ
ncbi:MAG: M18 family aminopeptidase [Chlamydiota bacterium]|nr:M18 family aminopeptidase [Chlamydiota bacterium]